MLFAIFAPGPMEMGIVALVAVLLFGNQLPKIARSLGRSIPEFRKGISGMENLTKDISDEINKK